MKRLWCFIFGHRFEVWQQFSPTSRRVVCDHCDGDWGMNDDVRAFVPWCEDLERLYRVQGIRLRRRA